MVLRENWNVGIMEETTPEYWNSGILE